MVLIFLTASLGLPEERMKLYVNSWFPNWLSGEEPDSERYAYVDWIEH